MICSSCMMWHATLLMMYFITDPILLDDVNNIAKHMDTLCPNTIERLTLKLRIAIDPKLVSKPDWAVPLAILVELKKKGCKEPEVLSKSYFARKLAETANEIKSKDDKKKLFNVVHLLDDESEYRSILHLILSYVLFLVLASISSDKKENITEKYEHQRL